MMCRLLKIQIVRFLVVGSLNTGLSYGLYALLLLLGLGFLLANLVATVIGILISFSTQGRFVFRNTDRRLLWRFGCSWLVLWLFNVSLIALMVHAGVSAYLAGAVALVPVVLASFLIQRHFVFGATGRGVPSN